MPDVSDQDFQMDRDPDPTSRPEAWHQGRCRNCHRPLDDHCHLHGLTQRPICPALLDVDPPCGPNI